MDDMDIVMTKWRGYYIFSSDPTTVDKFADIDSLIEHVVSEKGTGLSNDSDEPYRAINGGMRLPHGAIKALGKVTVKEAKPVLLKMSQVCGLEGFILNPLITVFLANIPHEVLIDLGKPWYDEPVWDNVEINPFDLVGFLVGLSAVCRDAVQASRHVYWIVETE